MSEIRYIDCEYYVNSLDRASLSLGGRRVEGSIPLGAYLEDLGRGADGPAETSPERCIERGIEALHQLADSEGTGSQLFRLLFPRESELEALYAAFRHRPLRFKLLLAEDLPILQSLPWETLTDPSTSARGASMSRPFARGEHCVLLRSVDRVCRLKTLADHPLRVLVAIASPQSLMSQTSAPSILPIDQIRADLDEFLGLRPAVYDVDYLQLPVTAEALRARLVEGKYHILHLIAHGQRGDNGTAILLQEDSHAFRPLSSAVFANAIPSTPQLRLIMLMVCHSAAAGSADRGIASGSQLEGAEGRSESLASALVGKGFPTVVAMGRRISAGEATTFCRGFYGTLRLTGEVDRAVNSGRQSLYLNHSPTDPRGELARLPKYWSAPVLFAQKGSERLWTTFQNRVRRRRYLRRAAGMVAVAALFLAVVMVWRAPKPPVPATITLEKSRLDPDLDERIYRTGLFRAIETSIVRAADFDPKEAPHAGEPHVVMAVRISPVGAPDSASTTTDDGAAHVTDQVTLSCRGRGFPRRPAWWPWTAARAQCERLDGVDFEFARAHSIRQVEAGIHRALGSPAPPPVVLDAEVAERIENASVAHLLKDQEQRFHNLRQAKKIAARLDPVQLETVKNYSSLWLPEPGFADSLVGPASLASDLFAQATRSRLQKDTFEAWATLNLLEINHQNEGLPLNRGYLQIEVEKLRFSLGHPDLPPRVEESVRGLESIARHYPRRFPDLRPSTGAQNAAAKGTDGHGVVDAPTTPRFQREVRIAALFEIAHIYALQLATTGSVSAHTLGTAVQSALSRILQATGHSSDEVDAYRFLSRILEGHRVHASVAIADSTHSGISYETQVRQLEAEGFIIHPRQWPNDSGAATECPTIVEVPYKTAEKEIEARMIDLIVFTNWVAASHRPCGIALGTSLLNHYIPRMAKQASTRAPSESMVSNMEIYQNIVAANIGMWSYRSSHPENLEKSRVLLSEPHRFFRDRSLHQPQGSAVQGYLNKIRAYLAAIYVEQGFYQTSNVISQEILNTSPRHTSALLMLVKTGLLEGDLDGVDAHLRVLENLDLSSPFRHRVHYLRAKERYLSGSPSEALAMIEASDGIAGFDFEKPSESVRKRRIDTYLLRLYAAVLTDLGRLSEAEAILTALPFSKDAMSTSSAVDHGLTEIALAKLYLVQGRVEDAYTTLKDWREEDVEIHVTSGLAALLPQALTTLARIDMIRGDIKTANWTNTKARKALVDIQQRDRETARRLSGGAPDLPSTPDFWFTTATLPMALLDAEIAVESSWARSAKESCAAKEVALTSAAAGVSHLPSWRNEYLLLRSKASHCRGAMKSVRAFFENMCASDESIPWDLRQRTLEFAERAHLAPLTCLPAVAAS